MRLSRLAALIAVLGLTLAAYCPSANAASQRYGPLGSQFTASFPSKPRSASNSTSLLQNFPAGSHAYAYWLSPSTQIFGHNVPVPAPPSFIVFVGVLSSAAGGASYVQLVGSLPGMKVVTLDGLSGYEFLGSEGSKLNQGNKLTDPKATEGVLGLRRGATVYLVYAITAGRPAAQAFLASFRPV